MRNYREWCDAWSASVPDWLENADIAINGDHQVGTALYERSSTLLFDTVAVYLAYDESLVEIEKLPIAIDNTGSTQISPGAPQVRAATSWQDLDGFTDHLVERLLSRSRRCESAPVNLASRPPVPLQTLPLPAPINY